MSQEPTILFGDGTLGRFNKFEHDSGEEDDYVYIYYHPEGFMSKLTKYPEAKRKKDLVFFRPVKKGIQGTQDEWVFDFSPNSALRKFMDTTMSEEMEKLRERNRMLQLENSDLKIKIQKYASGTESAVAQAESITKHKQQSTSLNSAFGMARPQINPSSRFGNL